MAEQFYLGLGVLNSNTDYISRIVNSKFLFTVETVLSSPTGVNNMGNVFYPN